MKNHTFGRTGLPARLRDARLAAGTSAAEAARALGVRRAAIYEMENGDRKVGAAELFQLADLYKVSATWLMERDSTGARDHRARHVAQLLTGLTGPQLGQLAAAIALVRQPHGRSENLPDWRKRTP